MEQLDLKPGRRVMEIGAGYNAALMTYLVGDRRHVVTIDVDEDIVSGAWQHLAASGIENVDVIHLDGDHGVSRWCTL